MVFDLVDLINQVYINKFSKKDKLSDTFVTKVLLGVFGCTPAYDRYFRISVKNCGICSSTFSRSSLKNLYSYYELYYDNFEELRHQFIRENVYYTPMKMIDMCFWQLGYDLDKENGEYSS